MTVVLDTSALLAVLLNEPREDRVRPVLAEAVISAVTSAEVVARLVECRAGEELIGLAEGLVGQGVVPLDAAQGETSGGLRALTRKAGLSLGDRCCPALAKTMGAKALTADRTWAGLGLGITIELVR